MGPQLLGDEVGKVPDHYYGTVPGVWCRPKENHRAKSLCQIELHHEGESGAGPVGFPAVIERGIIIRIEAIKWNCPHHVVRRYTGEEGKDIPAPLLAENCRLRGQNGGWSRCGELLPTRRPERPGCGRHSWPDTGLHLPVPATLHGWLRGRAGRQHRLNRSAEWA